jgi:FADH2 O2-dependent halogenase
MDRFELFSSLSLLYFAAASFSETARRLGKPQLADSFLLCRNPDFSKQLLRFCEAARQRLSAGDAGKLEQQIREAIAPFDVAGLTDRSRHPWYPANVSDLHRSAAKVGASAGEITAMLAKCGLTPHTEPLA